MSEEALTLHKKYKGKLSVDSKVPFTEENLNLVYTPGVGSVSSAIAEDTKKVYDYTIKGNTVAIVSDGTAVLGLGDIGPEAALPVMEGKALLLKELAGVDGFPICLDTKDEQEIITAVKAIAPVFGAINLEDIAAPKCFAIEKALQDIGIPVMHDDQHGTAVVTLAGLINACTVTGKTFEELNVVISGAGAAGTAIANLLLCVGHDAKLCKGVHNIVLCDSKGIISKERTDLNEEKQKLASITNNDNKTGTLQEALVDADVFIGVSAPNIVTQEMIKGMADKPLVFAMANPIPEIMPEDALAAGAAVVATGRSDFPNQVNNALAFPGIYKGLLDAQATTIKHDVFLAAANALAATCTNPTATMILPSLFDKNLTPAIAKAVQAVA